MINSADDGGEQLLMNEEQLMIAYGFCVSTGEHPCSSIVGAFYRIINAIEMRGGHRDSGPQVE